jgi:hypothetical protein
MRNEEDVRGVKHARATFGKHGVDVSRADVRITKGTLTVRGMVSFVRGSAATNMKAELEIIAKNLRSNPAIKNVVYEVSYSGMGM